MNEIKVIQGSEEWFNLRLGKITASKFKDLIKSPKQKLNWTKIQESILYSIASERMTESREESFKSSAMQWGNDIEPLARKAYEIEKMVKVRQCGFFVKSEYTGGSPDGIIEGEGAVEIKCPTSKQHLRYLKHPDELLNDYKWQALGHIYNTGLDYCDLISFDPRYKDEGKQIVIIRLLKVDYIDDLITLESRLDEAIVFIKDLEK